jgi:1,2-diacylglycerol 3-alpha-glucosyltransferase
MQIALCSDSFLPVVDGVGRVVYQYACSLANAGHEVYVITPMQDAGYRGKYPFEMVEFVSVKMPSAPQYQTGIAPLDFHYIERISMIKLDLIHVHAPGFAGVEALRLADRLDIPLVGTFHSKYYDDFLRVTHSDVLASLGSRFVAEFYERCDDVWTVSVDAADTLRSYGFRSEIAIVQNGTEMRSPCPESEIAARAQFNLGGDPVLLYVGQLDFKKNLRRIIEAAALLKKRGYAFQLVFAGQGQDREKLAEQAAELGLEQLVFAGHITDRDLLDGLYMAADLFVFPSLYDTAGLVVREAAMMGTPSVVVKDTAPAEVITPGLNGLVCENTADSLCAAMQQYLFETSGADRAAMRERVRESVPLPWEKVMAEVDERYRAILARGKHKRLRISRIFDTIR